MLYEVATQNEQFLLELAREVFDVAVGLANDAIDLVLGFAKSDSREQFYGERAFHFFAYHVLMPGSHSIVISLISGSLPSCFRELRFMTEMVR